MRRFYTYTLVELIVVVAIISFLALITKFSFNENNEDEVFNKNKKRIFLLKRAIVGYFINDQFVNGFYQDMGRLPKNLKELLENPNEETTFSSHEFTGIRKKWNGPYVNKGFENLFSNETRGGDDNFGWIYNYSNGDVSDLKPLEPADDDYADKTISDNSNTDPINSSSLKDVFIQSYGKDLKKTAFDIDKGYDNDYPAIPIILESDYLIKCSPWNIKKIIIYNLSGKEFKGKYFRFGIISSATDMDSPYNDRNEKLQENFLSNNDIHIPEIKKRARMILRGNLLSFGKLNAPFYLPKGQLSLVAYDPLQGKEGAIPYDNIDIEGDSLEERLYSLISPVRINAHYKSDLPREIEIFILPPITGTLQNPYLKKSNDQWLSYQNLQNSKEYHHWVVFDDDDNASAEAPIPAEDFSYLTFAYNIKRLYWFFYKKGDGDYDTHITDFNIRYGEDFAHDYTRLILSYRGSDEESDIKFSDSDKKLQFGKLNRKDNPEALPTGKPDDIMPPPEEDSE